MFKKLRMQFVAIVMVSVAIVLALVFAGICIANYRQAADEVEQALSTSIERASEGMRERPLDLGFGFMQGGLDDISVFWRSFGQNGRGPYSPGSSTDRAGEGDEVEELEELEDDADDADDAEVRGAIAAGRQGAGSLDADGDDALDAVAEYLGYDDFEDMFGGPRIGGPRDRESKVSVPVAVYAADSNGQLQIVSGFATASLDQDTLESARTELAGAADGSGTIGDLGLHYKKQEYDGTTYYAFADTDNTGRWKSLAVMLGIAGAGVLVVFFFIALALSNWALKPVREAWDSQRQFVADASHDLKTPLTVILANTSILMKHPENTIASESQWIESTQVEAQQMQGLVNEMLELAQVEAGQEVARAEHEPLDFSDLVDGETLLFDSMALERGCGYDCEIECGLRVMGNPQQLRKMVSTLIENAFKYVDEGGIIRVSMRSAGKSAELRVHNTGSAVAAEDIPHIFDRFYRTDKARTSGAGGFGLGLAIAREIARSHGGDIACESGETEGTSFIVTLPRL